MPKLSNRKKALSQKIFRCLYMDDYEISKGRNHLILVITETRMLVFICLLLCSNPAQSATMKCRLETLVVWLMTQWTILKKGSVENVYIQYMYLFMTRRNVLSSVQNYPSSCVSLR